MATIGDHVASSVTALQELKAAVQALTVELAAVRSELEAINGKTPALVGGKVPVGATVTGTVPISASEPLAVTTSQLPSALQSGKLKVTGLL